MKKISTLICLLLTFFLVKGQEEAQKAFSEGVKLLKENNYVEAEKKFSEAIEKGATNNGLKMSYIYKGFALNGQNKFDNALACFDKAIELDPSDWATYTDRGLTHAYKQEYENAKADFKTVLKNDSTGGQAEAAYYHLGKINMLLDNNVEAIKLFDKLLKLVPRDAEAYFLRGTAKGNLMEIDESIKDYDLAITYRPDYMEAYANRGIQKLNKIPVAEKISKKINCLEGPCSDLLKAKEMGDNSIDDFIFLYCKKCK